MSFDIFETSTVKVSDIRARSLQTPDICDTCLAGFQLALVRRGAFMRRVRKDYLLTDPASAALFEEGDPYRLEPFGRLGAQCTILSFNEDILPDQTRSELIRLRRLPLPPAAALAAQRVFRSIRNGQPSPLRVEEVSLWIAMCVSGLAGKRTRTPSATERRIAEDVRELIAANPFRRHSLGPIAREFNISPYHLAHVFKAVSGSSIGRYQMRLRLSMALDRLAQGEDNLSALALNFGFTSHSHFTRHFRREFGVAPSSAREMIATA